MRFESAILNSESSCKTGLQQTFDEKVGKSRTTYKPDKTSYEYKISEHSVLTVVTEKLPRQNLSGLGQAKGFDPAENHLTLTFW